MAHRKKGKTRKRALGDPSYELRGRIWVDGPDGTFIGYGRVVLLERIRELGSITKAAKSMNMSYRHAWLLIDSMNRQAPEPFVITATGGEGGGGTTVTKAGEQAIEMFRDAYNSLSVFLASEGKKFNKKKKR